MFRGLGDGMQQGAFIGHNHGGALQMGTIGSVERDLSALPALCLNHRIGQLDLAHFQNGGPDRCLKRQPGGKPKRKAKTIAPA